MAMVNFKEMIAGSSSAFVSRKQQRHIVPGGMLPFLYLFIRLSSYLRIYWNTFIKRERFRRDQVRSCIEMKITPYLTSCFSLYMKKLFVHNFLIYQKNVPYIFLHSTLLAHIVRELGLMLMKKFQHFPFFLFT